MRDHRRLTSEEIDGLENEGRLWVCEVCDAHCDTDAVGSECPKCGAPSCDPWGSMTAEERERFGNI